MRNVITATATPTTTSTMLDDAVDEITFSKLVERRCLPLPIQGLTNEQRARVAEIVAALEFS